MINRREFMIGTSGIMFTLASGGEAVAGVMKGSAHNMNLDKTTVSIVKTADRKTGIARAIDMLSLNPVRGKKVLIKPNFNTADDFPASTHNDTLISLIGKLKEMGAKSLAIGERSGPPATGSVMKSKGIYDICRDNKVDLINFEELSDAGWVRVRPQKSNWNDGFDVAMPVLEAECLVSTCCLKTHGYGGVFTMSLKLSVGLTHKRNMSELHSSFRSMRKMIAEINQAYSPSLIIMDAMEAFVDGGPMEGRKKRADVIVGGTDRIAVDAVGLAILKDLGSNDAVMNRKIFEQEQIARAVELGIGVSGPEKIELASPDAESRKYADRLKKILLRG